MRQSESEDDAGARKHSFIPVRAFFQINGGARVGDFRSLLPPAP